MTSEYRDRAPDLETTWQRRFNRPVSDSQIFASSLAVRQKISITCSTMVRRRDSKKRKDQRRLRMKGSLIRSSIGLNSQNSMRQLIPHNAAPSYIRID